MTLDPESASLLEQAHRKAGELAVKVAATESRADGEVSVQASGQSWAARAWARLTAKRDAKPEWAAGAEGSVRWLTTPRMPWWRRWR